MTPMDLKPNSRQVGLVSVVILLVLCFVLLGAVAAASEKEPLSSPSVDSQTASGYANRPRPPNPAMEGDGDQNRRPVPASQSSVDRTLVLEKNPGYYDAGSVAITRATAIFLDPDTAWTRYQANELDTIAPPGSALDTIKASPVYSPQLHVYPGTSTYIYAFSHDVPPLDNPLVRAALSAAIDRERLIREVLNGDELPALTYTPPRHFGHVDGYAAGIGHPYSPTVAAALLDASGYTGVPSITLMVNTSEHHLAIAQAVRDIWYETLGISVTVEHLAWDEYLKLLREGSAEERPGVWRVGWGSDYPDAHNWHGVAFGFYGPWTRYDNPDYYALVDEAAGEPDSAKRLELYEQAEATLVMTDTAIAPLYYAVSYRLTRPDLDRSYRSFGQRLDEWSFTPSQRPLETGRAAPVSLDPALSWDWDYLNQLFVALTGIDNDTGEAVPELATSWQASPDAVVYTFTLRSDVKWTDNTPVTAHDVEYGVLRSLDPDLNSSSSWLLWDIENAQAYSERSVTDPDLVGVEALSDTLIRFKLERPAAYFPLVAGLPPARPQPQATIETYGPAWTHPNNIVTNGPYKLVHWDQSPYLRIRKWADGDPGPGDDFVFTIQYRNDGGDAAEGCLITDTMMGGMEYISDTSVFPSSGSGLGPIVWDVGTLDAYSNGEFEVYVQVTAPNSETITNLVEITTDDPYDLGNDSEKESEWSGHVEGPWTMVNYGMDQVQVPYPAGHTIWISATDGTSSYFASGTTVEGDGWWSDAGYVTRWEDWTPEQPDIEPLYTVACSSDDGYLSTIKVGTITGTVNLADRSISGRIYAPWFADTLDVLCHPHTQWPFLYVQATAEPDGSVGYYCQWDPDQWSHMSQDDIHVTYLEPDDGDWVTNRFPNPKLSLNVNYGHDWVEGTYETGHTVWITVTESDGTTIKGSAVLTTGQVPWWDDRTGFSTNWHGWSGERPDIQALDWVHGRVDNGNTATLQLGIISGLFSSRSDSVQGTIEANWISEEVVVECHTWDAPGDAPRKEDVVSPNGVDRYLCSWDPHTEWDVQPDEYVAVSYRVPGGGNVFNTFDADQRVYLPLILKGY
jgi:uncharacterized repeat protein (TIGR01451 family)